MDLPVLHLLTSLYLVERKQKNWMQRLISRTPLGSSAKMKKVPRQYIVMSMLQVVCFLGCIPEEEMKFVLMHLPGGVTCKEVDEIIETVDRNGEFR